MALAISCTRVAFLQEISLEKLIIYIVDEQCKDSWISYEVGPDEKTQKYVSRRLVPPQSLIYDLSRSRLLKSQLQSNRNLSITQVSTQSQISLSVYSGNEEEEVKRLSVGHSVSVCVCRSPLSTALQQSSDPLRDNYIGQCGSDVFVTDGFNSWNKTERLGIHVGDVNSFHNRALKKSEDLMRQDRSIAVAFHNQTEMEKNEHRVQLDASITACRFVLKNALPFRNC
ncbi:hypothetical protein L6452_44511 [Arctium lappa]|uniref:Uncharacterized protein n=1 Tax=Arctium lappa TaxID=4217 RepID=A0ACB8XH18_ARCLA|nr:hypothetical protein L6452_44511 [Arctium lappa]